MEIRTRIGCVKGSAAVICLLHAWRLASRTEPGLQLQQQLHASEIQVLIQLVCCGVDAGLRAWFFVVG